MNDVEALEPRRLLAFGDFDPSFGSGGHLSTGPSETNFNSDIYDRDHLLVLSDAHSIAAAYQGIVERKADGSIETSFGDGGIAKLPDGWIFNFGLHESGDRHLFASVVKSGDVAQLGFAKFNLDGSLDATYGDHGIAGIPLQGEDSIDDWQVTRGGTIYYQHGFADAYGSGTALSRVFSSGRDDPNGVGSGPIPAPPRRSRLHLELKQSTAQIVIDSHDRIRLVQIADWERTDYPFNDDGEQLTQTTVFERFLSVIAINSRGRVDTSFGHAGVTYVPLATGLSSYPEPSLAISSVTQPGTDNLLLAVDDKRLDLIEMNPRGRVVSANVRLDGPYEPFVSGMRWLADGRVVALVGAQGVESNAIAILAKSADGKWHVGQPVMPQHLPVQTRSMTSIAVTPDDKLLIGGNWELGVGTGGSQDNVDFQLEQVFLAPVGDSASLPKVIPGGRQNVAIYDSTGTLHVVYFDANQNALYYTARDSTGRWPWYYPNYVDYGTNAVNDLTISLDTGADQPAIAYFDPALGQLKFAEHNTFDQWQVETVDAPGLSIEHPNLIFAADHSAWISYYDRTAGELRFAHRAALDENGVGIWTTETVDHIGADVAGSSWSSIAVNADSDRFAIAYATRKGIKLAERLKGGGWSIATVTGTAAATREGTLAYQSPVGPEAENGPFRTIAYRDVATSTVRYAVRSAASSKWAIHAVANSSPVSDQFVRDVQFDAFGDPSDSDKLFWWDAKHNAIEYQETDGEGEISSTVYRTEHAAYGGGKYLTVAGSTIIYLDDASGDLVVSTFG